MLIKIQVLKLKKNLKLNAHYKITLQLKNFKFLFNYADH